MAGEFGYVSSLVGLFALVFCWDSLDILRTRQAELVQTIRIKLLEGITLGLMAMGAVGALVSIIVSATAESDTLLRLSHGLLDASLWQVTALLLVIPIVFIRMKWRLRAGPFVGIVGALPFAIHYLSFKDFSSAMEGISWLIPMIGALATLVTCYAILRGCWERLRKVSSPQG